MDKIKQEGRRKKEEGRNGEKRNAFWCFSSFPSAFSLLFLILCFAVSGCSSIPKKSSVQVQRVESVNDQLDAAQKVVGAMANKEVGRNDLKALATDIHKNEETRSAVQCILGGDGQKPVIKYSPVTGKHYSGDLEYDPETGVKLEIVPE